MRTDDESELQRALEERAVEELLTRYCRAIDRVDRDLLASCYHPDSVDHHPGLSPEQERDFVSYAIARGEQRRDQSGGTMHYLSNVRVEIDGDVAWSESYVHAFHWADPASDPQVNYAAGARYVDRVERRDGVWRIAERAVLTEFREDKADGAFTVYGKDAQLARRGLADPSYDRSLPSTTGS